MENSIGKLKKLRFKKGYRNLKNKKLGYKTLKNVKLFEEFEVNEINEIWKDKLQDVYNDLEDFESYDKMYGLVKKLGFKSAKEAWDKNPVIQGSTNPEDFKVVNENIQRA